MFFLPGNGPEAIKKATTGAIFTDQGITNRCISCSFHHMLHGNFRHPRINNTGIDRVDFNAFFFQLARQMNGTYGGTYAPRP